LYITAAVWVFTRWRHW